MLFNGSYGIMIIKKPCEKFRDCIAFIVAIRLDTITEVTEISFTDARSVCFAASCDFILRHNKRTLKINIVSFVVEN